MKAFGTTEREEDLFIEALKHTDSVARNSFLDRACAGKPALRACLERLLAVQTDTEEFFAEAERATRIQMRAH